MCEQVWFQSLPVKDRKIIENGLWLLLFIVGKQAFLFIIYVLVIIQY